MCFCLSHYLTDSKQSYFSTSRVSFAYDDNCKSVAFLSYFSPALLGGGGGGGNLFSLISGFQERGFQYAEDAKQILHQHSTLHKLPTATTSKWGAGT